MPCMLSGKRIHALGPTCFPTSSLHPCQEFSPTIGGTAHSQEAKTRPTTPPQAPDSTWARSASGRTKGRRAGCITEIFATHRTRWRSEDRVLGPAKIKGRSQVAQAIRSILTDLLSIIDSSHASATASAKKPSSTAGNAPAGFLGPLTKVANSISWDKPKRSIQIRCMPADVILLPSWPVSSFQAGEQDTNLPPEPNSSKRLPYPLADLQLKLKWQNAPFFDILMMIIAMPQRRHVPSKATQRHPGWRRART